MILTETQNKELDGLKNQIEAIERNIENAKYKLELAYSLYDKEKVNLIEKSIEFGNNKIKNMVNTQAISMNLDVNIVLDLIFDREYTLTKL